MRKSLIILPLVAVLLVGCNSGGKKSKKSTSEQEEEGDGLPCQDFGPKEYNGYRRVMTAPKEGKEYLMGFYHVTQETPRFMNGDQHKDDNGTYRYYLATTTDVEKACKLSVTYAADKQHYSIYVIGGGEKTLYDGAYLEIYEGAKSGGQKITTIRDVVTPVETFAYTVTSTVEPAYNVHTSMMQITDSTRADHQWGVFGCSSGDYETISAIDEFNFGNAFICHFWEKI